MDCPGNPQGQSFHVEISSDIIPSAENLRSKGIQLVTNCCVCGSSGENSRHIMFECLLSQAVWNSIYPNLRGNYQRFASEDNFWQRMFEMMQIDGVVELCMFTCWLLWGNRNRCLHDQICKASKSLVLSVNRLMDDFKAVHRRADIGPDLGMVQWIPPPEGILKINTDAAFHQSSKEAQLGVVGRDSRGYVWFCAIFKKHGVQSPLQALLMAISFGLQLAMDKGFRWLKWKLIL